MTDTRAVPPGSPPAGRAASGTVATAIVVAVAPAADGGCASLLPWQGRTLLAVLLEQLAESRVRDVRVLTRPAFAARVREAAPGADVRETAGVDADLREIAAVAAVARGDVLVIPGEVVASRAALSGLTENPQRATLALTGDTWRARHFAYRVRTRRGHIVSAASPYHAARRPTAAFLGALRITAGDLPAVAQSSARLAELVAAPPEEWRAELARKAAMWRAGLANTAAQPIDEEAEEDEDSEDEHEASLPTGDVTLSSEDEARLRTRLAAAPEDTSALVLLGLVRAGGDVRSFRLRRLFWWRSLSPEGIALAEERFARYDEDKVLLAAAVKSSDGFFTTFFVSPYSRYVARWAARRGITPNQVTVTSMAIGVLAAAAFATGERWGLVTGAVLLQVAFMTDCVDGQLARYTRQFSKFGAWLDSILDRTKEYLVFFGLGVGATLSAEPVWGMACAALTLQTVRHFSDFTFGASELNPVAKVVQPPLEQSLDTAAARRAERRNAREAGAPPAPPRTRSLPKRVLARWKRVDRLPGVLWLKKMAAFPIGERFAAISISAAFFDAYVTFVVLLSWGGFAVVYTLSGRVLRSVASSAAPSAARRTFDIVLFRDDGPVARAVGRALGRVPVPAMAPLVLGPLGVLALAFIVGEDASLAVTAAGVAWLVLTLGLTSARWPKPSFHWAVPSLVRIGEYATLTWLAATADAMPAAFALLAVLAFRHYDLAYRLRHRGETPPPWLNALAAGWDGRVILAWALLAAGLLPAAMYVWAALLGAVSVAETVASWRRFGRGLGAGDYDENDVEAD